ncbi:DUF4190 domain-containing protein [Microbacterium sp. MYb66]|uniref:DUF4190 domain-containing protein n=1 Tax=Microbacterium sp. MYb66 TaxID=1848692 RepID=UPI0011AFEAB8|nr:DUF4190 domain-containing protein [Microbacterium sp. MYb66]
MTNPPFPEQPTPDSSHPAAPPPAGAPTPPPPSAAAPAWDTTPNAAPAAGYPDSGAPAYAQPAATPPGRVLSIVGLVLAFLAAPVGLVISIVAAVKLGKAGQPKGLAIAGIVVGAIITIFWIIMLILAITVFAALGGMCAELGPGVWQVDGVTYTCG